MQNSKPKIETIAALYVAALATGPLAVARIMESAARWGYSVQQVLDAAKEARR